MHQINFGINYLNLEAFNQVQLKNTTFSVNNLGTETEILLSGNAQFSDTTNKSLMANNGGGFSLSGAYTTHFSILKNQPRKGTATMFFKDLGKLYANNQTLTYEQNDEEYNFNGIYIENISNYKPKIFQEQSPDTIYQRIISSAKFPLGHRFRIAPGRAACGGKARPRARRRPNHGRLQNPCDQKSWPRRRRP